VKLQRHIVRIDEKTDLAELLRSLMAATSTSVAELVLTSGLPHDRISQYRWGKRTPGVALLAELARALGYDLALIPREDAP
jgi:transcriptional regulator with XRE-family HTH domain